jgi:hypothetical protein
MVYIPALELVGLPLLWLDDPVTIPGGLALHGSYWGSVVGQELDEGGDMHPTLQQQVAVMLRCRMVEKAPGKVGSRLVPLGMVAVDDWHRLEDILNFERCPK